MRFNLTYVFADLTLDTLQASEAMQPKAFPVQVAKPEGPNTVRTQHSSTKSLEHGFLLHPGITRN